jgi:hypothetical protein
MRRLAGFAFDRLGDRFSKGGVAKIALRIALGRFDTRLHPNLGPKDEFICSEYVARCLGEAGLKVQWDGFGFIAPLGDDPLQQPTPIAERGAENSPFPEIRVW